MLMPPVCWCTLLAMQVRLLQSEYHVKVQLGSVVDQPAYRALPFHTAVVHVGLY